MKSGAYAKVLDRYCSFMSVPIYLDEIKEEEAKVTGEGDNAEDKPEEKKEEPKPINDTQPLYARAARTARTKTTSPVLPQGVPRI
ncbi:MAG: hypothetical protein ACLUN5_17575 [Oscillospiraceae bacterium]